jgi:endonuclease/exonuclease/phosphatase family metal-dependent hydrolase
MNLRLTTRNVPVLAATIALMAVAGCGGPPLQIAPVPTLRVMTYNIQAGGGNLDSIAAVIRRSDADVIALQEVDVHWSERSSYADQANDLSSKLGMQVRFAPIYDLPGSDASKPRREYGIALLSRFPILSFTNHVITRLSTQSADAVPSLAPGFLEVGIDFRGRRIRVFNTHLDYRSDPRVRESQVREMLDFIGEPSTPTIVFGDMNASPTAPELQPLLERLTDSWNPALGAGLTYPAKAPEKRIDYVLTSRHFAARDQAVLATQASDHRPVIVNLVLR